MGVSASFLQVLIQGRWRYMGGLFRKLLCGFQPPAFSPLCTGFKDHDLAPVTFLDFSSLEVSTGSDMDRERPPERKKELENWHQSDVELVEIQLLHSQK